MSRAPGYWRDYYQRNREKRLAQAKAYYWANPERKHADDARRREEKREEINAAKRSRYHANRDRHRAIMRNRHLITTHGITWAEKTAMVEAQGFRCAICQCDLRLISEAKWHVDHDHATGSIRAVLCARCNVALGLFGDNPKTMLRAAAYVVRHDTGFVSVEHVGDRKAEGW